MERFEQELIANEIEYKRRYEYMDWQKSTKLNGSDKNCFFCNFKNLCAQGNAGELKFQFINKENQIYLRPSDGTALPKILKDKIDERLTYYLPDEKDEKGKVTNITGKLKFFEVKDDQDNSQLRQFVSTIQNYFDSVKPEAIAIQTRQTKGRFSAAPSSFKSFNNCR